MAAEATRGHAAVGSRRYRPYGIIVTMTRATTSPAGRGPPQQTLPDYLKPGLDIVFVGINPGFYSAQVGHYFATPRNRFWAAFNAAGMAPEPLGPETDFRVMEYGIGFTDVVKRPTRSMSELKAAEFRDGARLLEEKLLRASPRIACFDGLSGYKNYLRYTGGDPDAATLGLQARRIGRARVFVLPSTSPANAAVPLDRIAEGLRELKELLGRVREGHGED